jgi:hypothetical protein
MYVGSTYARIVERVGSSVKELGAGGIAGLERAVHFIAHAHFRRKAVHDLQRIPHPDGRLPLPDRGRRDVALNAELARGA